MCVTQLNFAAGLGRWAANSANVRIIGGAGANLDFAGINATVPLIIFDQSKSIAFNVAGAVVSGIGIASTPPMPTRPQDEIAGKVFDILRSIDETMTNLTSEVSFDAKQKN